MKSKWLHLFSYVLKIRFVYLNIDDVELMDEDLGCYKLNETVEVTIGEGDTFLSELLDNVS